MRSGFDRRAPMPEPVNPYREPSAGHSGDAPGEFYVWRDCERAWRAWLASDEAVERVRRVLGRYSARQDERYRGLPTWSKHDREARAVLAALRGDET